MTKFVRQNDRSKSDNRMNFILFFRFSDLVLRVSYFPVLFLFRSQSTPCK